MLVDGVTTYLDFPLAGIQMDKKIKKVWDKLADDFKNKPKEPLDISLVGHSRGAATSILFAKALLKEKSDHAVTVHLLLIDPVSRSDRGAGMKLPPCTKTNKVGHCWTVYMMYARQSFSSP